MIHHHTVKLHIVSDLDIISSQLIHFQVINSIPKPLQYKAGLEFLSFRLIHTILYTAKDLSLDGSYESMETQMDPMS